jgi:mannosyltransferase OCH1-like enzyme
MNKMSVLSTMNNIITSDIIKRYKNEINKDRYMVNKLKTLSKIKYPNKQYYNPIIPLNIFQTWHTKNLPCAMKKTVENIISNNPAFKYYLYDDNDCRNFIKDNFSSDILNAYDKLIPGAYKADLWRYCILYKHGGIYLDIKYEIINGFKFINLTEKEHWVLDMDKNGIYNALMVCQPGNNILLLAISRIVENVRNKFYGCSPLEPTGPLLLANYFSISDKNNFDMYHDIYKTNENRFIFFNNYIILKSYNSYLDEHDKNKKIEYYGNLWLKRNIYK